MVRRATRAEIVRSQLDAVELLKIIKRRYTYEELAKITSTPATVLNRYIRGKILPSFDKAKSLLEILERQYDVEKEILSRIQINKAGVINNTQLLTDTRILRRIATNAFYAFKDKKVDKILTVASHGISLATHVANIFDVNLVVAKKHKEIGVRKHLETHFFVAEDFNLSLYLPQGLIKKRDRVLIVDDIVRSGIIQKALIDLVRTAKAWEVGIFIAISIGRVGLNRIRASTTSQTKVLVKIEKEMLHKLR
jgi:adenine phosphoribosyltransferase